ncbi:MAG: iron ABC transporter permease [Chloroflexi bacterium]|nr:iron ABC transporter permease [Chloroflexota bacterium]
MAAVASPLARASLGPAILAARPAQPGEQRLLFGAVSALVGVLVLVPLAVLLLATFKPGDALPWDAQALTLQNYAAVFGSQLTYTLLGSTLIYVAGTIVLGLALALPLAWLVERTDLPGRGLVFVALTTSLGVPTIFIAMGWSLWLSPRVGLANILLRQLFHLQATDGPLDGYTLGSMIWVTALAICPSMFLMLSALLRNSDAMLEEAGRMSGASGGHVWRRVTLPLLGPGLLAAVMYFTVTLIQHFEIPLALGLPGRQLVLSTYVYLLTKPPAGLPKYGLAATYALIALAFGLALMFLFVRLTRAAGRFRTVTGKGFRPRAIKLGRWRYVATASAGLYLVVAVAAPMLLLVWVSLLPSYQIPSFSALHSVTLAAYGRMLGSPRVLSAAVNTIVLMVSAAVLVTVISVLVGWLSLRSEMRGRRALDSVAFLPLAIPQVVLALAILLLYARTPIYGTVAILLVGQVTAYLAFGSRTIVTALTQIDRELEESARVHGGSLGVTLRKVVVPLLLPAIGNGMLWVGSHSMRDFTFPLMIGTAGNMVLSALIWGQWISNDQQGAAALSIVLAAGLALVAGVSRAFLFTRAEGQS